MLAQPITVPGRSGPPYYPLLGPKRSQLRAGEVGAVNLRAIEGGTVSGTDFVNPQISIKWFLQ